MRPQAFWFVHYAPTPTTALYRIGITWALLQAAAYHLMPARTIACANHHLGAIGPPTHLAPRVLPLMEGVLAWVAVHTELVRTLRVGISREVVRAGVVRART